MTTPDPRAPKGAAEDIDRLGTAGLRARGGLKWTAPPVDIGAWVAEHDYGTAPAVTAALHGVVSDGLLGYLPPAARTAMAQACAAWHRDRYGWDVPPERIHPVADVLDALRTTIELFSRPGSPVILPTPAYMPFRSAPLAWGRPVLEIPSTPGPRPTPDLDALADAFRAGGHLLVLTNPHNPTGVVLRPDELAAIAEVVERHGGRVFSDEIHAPLILPGARHTPYATVSDAAAAHTVTATSASKAWNLAGLKCAQVLLSSAADARTWEPHDHLATHGASTPGVVAATAAYRAGGPWLDAVLDHLDGTRRVLAEALAEHAPAVRFTPPEGTYLAWLDLRAGLGDGGGRTPGELLLDAGVSVVDGAACGDAGRGFVRLNMAMPRPLVHEAARRIGTVLARTGGGAP